MAGVKADPFTTALRNREGHKKEPGTKYFSPSDLVLPGKSHLPEFPTPECPRDQTFDTRSLGTTFYVQAIMVGLYVIFSPCVASCVGSLLCPFVS